MPLSASQFYARNISSLLLNMVRPRHFLPIHGELRQLRRHGQLAVEVARSSLRYVEKGQRTSDAVRRRGPTCRTRVGM